MEKEIIKALEENGFESIKKNWKEWKSCNDLFDHVAMKSVKFIIGFINQVENAKETHTCCTVHQKT